MGGENRQREKEESARRAKKPRCRRSRLSCLSRSPSLSPSTSTFSFSGSTRPPRATPAPSPHRGTFGAPLPRPTLPSCSDSQLRSFAPHASPLLTRKKHPRNLETKKLSPPRHAATAPALPLRPPPPPSATPKRPRPREMPAGSASAKEPAAATGAAAAATAGAGRTAAPTRGSCCRVPARAPCTPPASRAGSCTRRGPPRRPAAGSARGSSPTGRAC